MKKEEQKHDLNELTERTIHMKWAAQYCLTDVFLLFFEDKLFAEE